MEFLVKTPQWFPSLRAKTSEPLTLDMAYKILLDCPFLPLHLQ
jgi:hypothetical protein